MSFFKHHNIALKLSFIVVMDFENKFKNSSHVKEFKLKLLLSDFVSLTHLP